MAAAQLFLAGRVASRPLTASSRRNVTILSAGLVGLWVLSRTTGLPLGPDAGHPEAIRLADADATVLELAAVAVAVRVDISPVDSGPIRSRPARLSALPAVGLAAVVVAGLGFTTATEPQHGHEHAPHPAATAPPAE